MIFTVVSLVALGVAVKVAALTGGRPAAALTALGCLFIIVIAGSFLEAALSPELGHHVSVGGRYAGGGAGLGGMWGGGIGAGGGGFDGGGCGGGDGGGC